RNFLKIVRLQIEMSILPGFNRIAQSFSESNKVVKRSAALIVIPPDGRLGQIKMTVTARVVAFPKQRRVLFIGKRWNMQSMGSAETHLHSEKQVPFCPSFSEKICSFVQA